MKPIHFHLITLISILFLASCSSNKSIKTKESFSTLIKMDGTKQFSYTFIAPMSEIERFSERRGNGKPRKNGSREAYMLDQLGTMFDNGLNAKLNSTGFCRSGFITLENQSRPGAMQVKGECKETASDADREKFPNPAPKKVAVDVLE